MGVFFVCLTPLRLSAYKVRVTNRRLNMENQITGSGGHQASAVLADEIKRAKAKRSKQQEQPKQDSYITTESFANSGLQLA